MTSIIKNNRPIMVYQMGKVGSRSVYETLFDMKLGCPIYHCHVLNDLDSLEEKIKKQVSNPGSTLDVLEQGRELRRLIDDMPDQRWNIISLVRDPVAQDISSFFQGIEQVIPDIRHLTESGEIRIEELCKIFLEKWPHHHAPGEWFEKQFTPVFNIDVFSRSFPLQAGFDIFVNERFALLLIRLEDLDACIRTALKEFLSITDITIKKSNTSNEKWYKQLYKDFISNAELPGQFLNKMYCSRFAQHFYSPQELEIFRAKWCQRPGSEHKKTITALGQKNARNNRLEVSAFDDHPYGEKMLGAFDWRYYLNANKDVAKVCKTQKEALNHFSSYGYREGRAYNSKIGTALKNLDTEYYISRYPELGLKEISAAIVHFATCGFYEDRFINAATELAKHPFGNNMSADFEWKYYLSANRGVAEVCKTEAEAREHFFSRGYREGRAYNGKIGKALQYFRIRYYISRYPELGLKQDADALIHYAGYGYYEDRFANPETEIHYNAPIHIFQPVRSEAETILNVIKGKTTRFVLAARSKDGYASDYPKVSLPYDKILVHPREEACLVITGVGEAVSDIISLYFQNYESSGRNTESLTSEQGIEELYDQFDTIAPRVVRFFDHQYFCNLDVYGLPFNKESEYVVISNNYLRLFVYRRKGFHKMASALGDFLGIPLFNMGSDQSELKLPVYRKVMERFMLPKKKIKRLYDTPYMRHFFSPAEVDALIKYWTRPRIT